MKIVALGGSLRPYSVAYQILDLALKQAEKQADDIETALIDLRQLNLPFCTGEDKYPTYPDVEILRQHMQTASGILLATPEYHGSVSGVLKNALDLLDERQMRGKVIGLIGVLGGIPSSNALNTLRLVCRHFHSWVLPQQLIIPYADNSFESQGQLKDKQLEQRLEQLVQQLVTGARKLKN